MDIIESQANCLYIALQELVKKYSEFINFPIYLWSSKEVDVEVPVDEDEEADKETPPGRVLSLDFLVEIGSTVLNFSCRPAKCASALCRMHVSPRMYHIPL